MIISLSKEAAIEMIAEEFLERFKDYEGCTNCKHQPEPMRMCEWGERRDHVEPICSGWERRQDDKH